MPCRCASARAAGSARTASGRIRRIWRSCPCCWQGLTDASVAKQLDLGLRTVQRRVKGLMELTGVSTRLQLGWHAYERGWVARTGSGA